MKRRILALLLNNDSDKSVVSRCHEVETQVVHPGFTGDTCSLFTDANVKSITVIYKDGSVVHSFAEDAIPTSPAIRLAPDLVHLSKFNLLRR